MQGQTHDGGLGVGVESDEITLKVVGYIGHVLWGHGGVDHEVGWRGRSGRVIGEGGREVSEGVKGVVPPDVVRDWVGPDLVFEATGGDLEIIVGVAPATDTGRRVIKEGGTLNVMCV